MRAVVVWRAWVPLAAAVLALASGLPAQASADPGWHVQSVISTGAGDSGILFDVAADAPGDAWAVGETYEHGATPPPLIVRWNGNSWAQVTLPAPVLAAVSDSVFESVSASSPRNVWAFSDTTRWLRFDGSRWTSGRLVKPTRSGQVLITSVLALSKTDVWAFGGKLTSTGQGGYAAHFDGSRWTPTPVPGKGLIDGRSAVAAGDVWAVEGSALGIRPGPGAGALVHWSGRTWHQVRLPGALSNAQLSSVLARSDKDVWVGGATGNAKNGTTEAVGHWNGRAWAVTRIPARATPKKFAVTGLAPDGKGGLWAIGNCKTCFSSVLTRVWHHASGAWKWAPVAAKDPAGILAIAPVPATTSVWGAGAILTDQAQKGLITLAGAAPR
jgi:hypothetical protein